MLTCSKFVIALINWYIFLNVCLNFYINFCGVVNNFEECKRALRPKRETKKYGLLLKKIEFQHQTYVLVVENMICPCPSLLSFENFLGLVLKKEFIFTLQS